MTWQEWARQFLVEERKRKLTTIDLLSNGTISTNRMENGIRVDTTEEAIATEKAHVAELEEILTEAGCAFDA